MIRFIELVFWFLVVAAELKTEEVELGLILLSYILPDNFSRGSEHRKTATIGIWWGLRFPSTQS